MIYGCRKENKADGHLPPQLTDAKTWYENTYPVKINVKGSLQTQTKSRDLTQWIKPDWQHPQEYIRDNKTVIELPIDPGAKFSSAIQLNKNRYNPAYTRSYYLLINDGKQYDAYIMTIVADSAYLNNDMSKLANNTYRKHDADFSGSVLYFTPKGNYIGGYGYKNGQLMAPDLADEAANTPKIQTINPGKPVTNVIKQVCTDWYIVYYVNGVYDSDEYLTTTCVNVDDGTVPGSGGSPVPAPPRCPSGSHTGPPVTPPCTPTVLVSSISSGQVKVNYVQPPPDGGMQPPEQVACVVDPPAKPCPLPIITNNIKNPCLKDIINKMTNKNLSGETSNIINNVFNSSDKINLTFNEFSNVNAAPAMTDPPTITNSGIYNETINLSLAQLNGTSQEYVAIITTHEILHAYMNYNGQYVTQLSQHQQMA